MSAPGRKSLFFLVLAPLASVLLLPLPAGGQEVTLGSHGGADVLWAGKDVRGWDVQAGLRWDAGPELVVGYGFGFTGGEGQTFCPAVPDFTTPVICQRDGRVPTFTVFQTAYLHPRYWIGGAPRTPRPAGWPERIDPHLPSGKAAGAGRGDSRVPDAARIQAAGERRALRERRRMGGPSVGFWERTGIYVGPRLGLAWGPGLDRGAGSVVGAEAGLEYRESDHFSVLAAVVLDALTVRGEEDLRWRTARTGFRLGTVFHF